MKIFLVLSAVVAVVLCRPDGLGYQYNVPKTSYGVPVLDQPTSSSNYQPATYQTNAASVSKTTFQVQPSIPIHSASYKSTENVQSGGYQTGPISIGNTGYVSDYAYQTSNYQKPVEYQQFSTNYQQVNDYKPVESNYVNLNSGYKQSNTGYQQSQGSTGYHQLQSSSGYQQGGFLQAGSGIQSVQKSVANQYVQLPQNQPTQVFKHFYVHTAPEEPETPRVRHIPPPPPPQKHYKVIFIKAPAPAAPATTIVQYPQQIEEKTLVYVLSKKAEDKSHVVYPKVEQKPPSKPEVYYIKYDKEHNTEGVINNIVSGIKGEPAQGNYQQNNEEYSSGGFGGSSFTVGGSEQAAPSYVDTNSNFVSSSDSSHAADESTSQVQGLPHHTYGVPSFRN